MARLGDQEHVRELAEKAIRDEWNVDGFTAEQICTVLGEAVVLSADRLDALRKGLEDEVERLRIEAQEAKAQRDALLRAIQETRPCSPISRLQGPPRHMDQLYATATRIEESVTAYEEALDSSGGEG